jgi:hypothetical protein
VVKLPAAVLGKLNRKARANFGDEGNSGDSFRAIKGMRVLTKERVVQLLASSYNLGRDVAERGVDWLTTAPELPAEQGQPWKWQVAKTGVSGGGAPEAESSKPRLEDVAI